MPENFEMVQKGFRILQPLLSGYIAQEMNQFYHEDWWEHVLDDLGETGRDLPEGGEYDELVASLDMANCLRLFDREWGSLFRLKLSVDYRTWAKELMGDRNKTAHIARDDLNNDDTWRALDTMSRLCEVIDSEGAEKIKELQRQVRYGSAESSVAVTTNNSAVGNNNSRASVILASMLSNDLPSWRDIIEPHPDVAQGRYKNAEFAADLAQVARGEGSFEYRDPVEFFARTYVTEGMTGLLVQALKRISGQDGEPVIQLKTAFGGGKTHSMLALYHMLNGKTSLDKIPNIKPVLEQAGLSALPKANIAVLVGTSLDPSKSRRPQSFPGITINTLWGEMAAQLAEGLHKPDLYNYVKEADRKGVSPGSEKLKNLFNSAGPCLILMDELVAYAKKIYGRTDLPAGTFDNFITFIQEITEAARASKNSLVVASIPESDMEIGGEAGQSALASIEHTFGRMESVWKPVAANEGFEVVRRRLFLDCKDPERRDLVCSRYSQMYLENPSDFPIECRELEYRQRMISCYPIHPEVFDRLYSDWATLDKFQRTRGVLRLMAAVIHELWMGNDGSSMIMPGSIPLDVPNVRNELTRYLDEGWNPIIDKEIDGKNSIPYSKDQGTQRYGQKMAARRVARTIMLGSAPTNRAQTVRGIESSNIRLGVVQPDENIADFNDALGTLQNSLAYLYTNPSGDRSWYDTRPTLRKTVEDRAIQITENDIDSEIESRIHKLRSEAPFAGIHICPSSSLDVPDEQTVRLVILRPSDVYKASEEHNDAMAKANEILSNRGNSPRLYRNMLAFVAPDKDLIGALKQEVRLYLAWLSVKCDSETLNLDAAQNKETKNSIERCDNTVELRIKETYCWLMVPSIDRRTDLKTIKWDINRISGGTESIVIKAAKKMVQNDVLINKWAPALLLMVLDDLLWKEADYIQVKKLWEYMTTYCYLPRLANIDVLKDSICSGVNSTEYFAIAAGFSDDHYIDLRYNTLISDILPSEIIVKNIVALKQIAKDDGKVITDDNGNHQNSSVGNEPNVVIQQPISVPKNTHFYMSAVLDNTRINRDVQKFAEEVINNLTSTDGSSVEVSLEIRAKVSNGFSDSTVRTVNENCATLKAKTYGFDDNDS